MLETQYILKDILGHTDKMMKKMGTLKQELVGMGKVDETSNHVIRSILKRLEKKYGMIDYFNIFVVKDTFFASI